MARRESKFHGQWYPKDPQAVQDYLGARDPLDKAIAAVCPHAGWMYSGRVAGKVYSRLPAADRYVLIGPNHIGAGAPSSIYPEGEWRIPQGTLRVDNLLATKIQNHSEYLEPDTLAHEREHSLEVQLPFLWATNPQAGIVPITMRDYHPEVCQDIGRAVARALQKEKELITLLIASTDFTHYESRPLAQKKDQYALEQILALDPAGLLEVCDRFGITMCGAGPTAAVLTAAVELGAREAVQVAYATSGDVTGDDDSVVGYAGVIIR